MCRITILFGDQFHKKSIIVLFVLSFITLLFVSCNSYTDKKIEYFYLPDSLPLLSGNYHNTYDGINSEVRLIVYYDSTQCTSCNAKKILFWNNLINYVEKHSEIASVVMIFSPKDGESQIMEHILLDNMINYPVYIDSLNTVSKMNPNIHGRLVCLLDKSNRIMITGDPISSKKDWEHFIDELNKLFKNEED